MNKSLRLIIILIIGHTLTSSAHVYFEGYIGGMLGRSKISCLKTEDTYGVQELTAFFNAPAKKLSPSAAGGLKIGWWPNHSKSKRDNEDCIAWWEYFGCYLDACLNNLNYKHRTCSTDICYSNAGSTASGRTDICLSSCGPSATLAFMLACRYGFLATDTIPFGRIQPYLAIGPAGLFTRQKTCLVIEPNQVDGNHLTILLNNAYTIGPSQKHWFHGPCCALDTGIRFLPKPHYFLDLFFNYRFSPVRIYSACPQKICMKNRYNLFSFSIGLGYEF